LPGGSVRNNGAILGKAGGDLNSLGAFIDRFTTISSMDLKMPSPIWGSSSSPEYLSARSPSPEPVLNLVESTIASSSTNRTTNGSSSSSSLGRSSGSSSSTTRQSSQQASSSSGRGVASRSTAEPLSFEDEIIELLTEDSKDNEPISKRLRQVIELDASQDSAEDSGTRVPEVTHENFHSRIKDNITCSICKDILHNAVCLVPCSHLLCGGCFVQLKESKSALSGNNVACPECRKKVSMVMDAPPGLRSIITDYLDLHPEDKRPDDAIRELDEQSKRIQRGVPLSLAAARHRQVPSPYRNQLYEENHAPRSFAELLGYYDPSAPGGEDLRGAFGRQRAPSAAAAAASTNRAFPTIVNFEDAVTRFMDATQANRAVAVRHIRNAQRNSMDLNTVIAGYMDQPRNPSDNRHAATVVDLATQPGLYNQ
jgi:hypothetical protein